MAISICLVACNSPATKSDFKRDSTLKGSSSVQVSKITDSSITNNRVFIYDEGSVPSYGIDTVRALILKIKWEEDTSGDGDGSKEVLDEKIYNSLPFNQKFTYHMIHPESYSQMCDILPLREHGENRIYGELPDNFGEYEWSDRQVKFFKENRDKVEQLIKETIEKNNIVGGNFKEAIVEMDGKELIPFLINFYNKEKKDHYILTVLMLLMKNNQYPEFLNSISCRKLYGETTDTYSNYLVYNKANEALIIQRATNFYNGYHAK